MLDTTRTDGGRRDEIFVDIVEKLSCTFNSSGYLQASQIDGAIVVCLRLTRPLDLLYLSTTNGSPLQQAAARTFCRV